jgi:hypothetical protein
MLTLFNTSSAAFSRTPHMRRPACTCSSNRQQPCKTRDVKRRRQFHTVAGIIEHQLRHRRTSTRPCYRARPLEWHHLIVLVALLAPAHEARDVPATPKMRRAEDLPGQRPGMRLQCRCRRLHGCWRRARRRRRWQTCSVEFTSYQSSSS